MFFFFNLSNSLEIKVENHIATRRFANSASSIRFDAILLLIFLFRAVGIGILRLVCARIRVVDLDTAVAQIDIF